MLSQLVKPWLPCQVIEREEMALYEQQMAAAEAGAAEARRRYRRMREVGLHTKSTCRFWICKLWSCAVRAAAVTRNAG